MTPETHQTGYTIPFNLPVASHIVSDSDILRLQELSIELKKQKYSTELVKSGIDKVKEDRCML